MKTLKIILIYVVAYLIISFINIDIDFRNWDVFERVLYVFMCSVVHFVYVSDFKEFTDELDKR